MNAYQLYRAISPVFRRPRMRRFREVVAAGRGERLLDIGGFPDFWNHSGIESTITVLNLPSSPAPTGPFPANVEVAVGDGCALPFPDRAFDVGFSNSVIEHVGTWERQQAFAAEVRRVSRRLWVQTPAREFFIEPHLIAPFVHWTPRTWQRRLIRNWTVRGWIDRPSPSAVEAFLAEVRLLTRHEMRMLFPDCTILRERFLGMTKSYIAVRTAP